MFTSDILNIEFFDDFNTKNSANEYTVITSANQPTLQNVGSKLQIIGADTTAGNFCFLTPNINTFCDYKNAKIAISFNVAQPVSGKCYPEFGFFTSPTVFVIFSVNHSNNNFCIRQNGNIIATSSVPFEYNKNYIAFFDFNPAGNRISLFIGEYNTTNNFSNVKNVIREATITAPSDLSFPVFGMSIYENIVGISPTISVDLFKYSIERKPI